MNDDVRYGIFLRPDPATCWAVTQITHAVNKQYGLVSAGAFPPHATLVGNLATDASEGDLVDALDPVFADVGPITVFNGGVVGHGQGWEYNVNIDAIGTGVNEPLGAIAAAVKSAVLPLSLPRADFKVTPVEAYEFAGHLGLASHELSVDNSLYEEIGEFIAGLPISAPSSFAARWYSLFEFRSDWAGQWWKTMTWRHLHSWDVAAPGERTSA